MRGAIVNCLIFISMIPSIASLKLMVRRKPVAILRSLSNSNDQEGVEWERWQYGSFAREDNVPGPIGQSEGDVVSELSDSAPETQSLNATDMWDYLTLEEVEKGVSLLSSFTSKERLERLQNVLGRRTRNSRLVFENPSNANNVWASLRTLDAFGIQYADIVVGNGSDAYRHHWRRNGMNSAMGAQKWLSVKSHPSSSECLLELKAQGYRIVATDIHQSSLSVDDVDWSQPCAIVIGNEEKGISDEVRAIADCSFHIPMKGFVESLNMSVACAILCAFLQSKGALTADLSYGEQQRTLLSWLARTVPGSTAILRRSSVPIVGNNLYPPLKSHRKSRKPF